MKFHVRPPWQPSVRPVLPDGNRAWFSPDTDICLRRICPPTVPYTLLTGSAIDTKAGQGSGTVALIRFLSKFSTPGQRVRLADQGTLSASRGWLVKPLAAPTKPHPPDDISRALATTTAPPGGAERIMTIKSAIGPRRMRLGGQQSVNPTGCLHLNT